MVEHKYIRSQALGEVVADTCLLSTQEVSHGVVCFMLLSAETASTTGHQRLSAQLLRRRQERVARRHFGNFKRTAGSTPRHSHS
jgi:hypothetical protein